MLDLYHRQWEGRPLGDDDFVISAKEKTQLQLRERRHPCTPAGPRRPIRVEHEYRRHGTCAYQAAWDVHQARLFGHVVERSTGAAFDQLVAHVMVQEPYASAHRVFWIVSHSVIAGRLAGALRRIGRRDMADELSDTQAGHRVRESDPFETDRLLPEIRARTPAIVARMQGMWEAMRGAVVETFPDRTPALSPETYLERVEAMYDRDAYHSLSIEGYRVTPPPSSVSGREHGTPSRTSRTRKAATRSPRVDTGWPSNE